MEKFKYAPGVPGYGTFGKDGSMGLTGNGMFFTNIDVGVNRSDINSRIINNRDLWAGSISVLPNNRQYQKGDLMIDSDGNVYEIDPSSTGDKFTYKGSLSTAQFFSFVTQNDFGFERWSNTIPNYIIDNVNSITVEDYTTSPEKVYNIKPSNFGRIEYSDIDNDSYNAFTIYVADNTSDNNALAIVREINTNTFHIGNQNNSRDLARNVNLTFDVKNLKVSRDANNHFTSTTDSGTVLTNHEIDANVLFNDSFKRNPDSFRLTPISSNTIDVSWNKYELLGTNDKNIVDSAKVDLYFYPYVTNYDGSEYRIYNGNPFDLSSNVILRNIDASGKISFKSLPISTQYEAFLEADFNGWTRRSVRKTAITGLIPLLYVVDPCLYTLTADASGRFATPGTYVYGINVSTNTNFNLTDTVIKQTSPTLIDNPTWITVNPMNQTVSSPGHYQVDVSLSTKIDAGSRTAVITFSSAYDPDPTVTITQNGTTTITPYGISLPSTEGTPTTTSITKRAPVYVNNLPSNTYLDVSIYITVHWKGGSSAPYTWTFTLRDQNGITLTSGNHTVPKGITNTGSTTITTYTAVNYNIGTSLVLWPTLEADFDNTGSAWYTWAEITMVPIYKSGDNVTLIVDESNSNPYWNVMAIEIPIDGVHAPAIA